MNGFLLIDKPEGLTSHDVVFAVRKATGIRRVGHTGTLDPMATGVLPVAIGKATRMTEYMLQDDKAYRGAFQLGYISDTYDRTGTLTATDTAECRIHEADGIFASFLGEQDQVPPMYSAKKVQGKKLYEFARKGEVIPRKSVRITIFSFDVRMEHYAGTFYAHVSKGTYIRSIIHDMGQKFGCGAILTKLRRVQSGSFHIEDCIPYASLAEMEYHDLKNHLLPPDAAILETPALTVKHDEALRLSHGQSLPIDEPDCELLRVYEGNRFLGPGRIENRIVKLIKVLEQTEQ